MSLADVVSLSISLANPIVSRAGFGTGLFLTAEAVGKFQGKTKLYASADELLEDGFSPTGITHRKASIYMSQSPRPAGFKVGKRDASAAAACSLSFTFLEDVAGSEYWIEIAGERYEYTLGTGEDEEDAAAEIADLIDAEAAYTAADTTGVIAFGVVAAGVFPAIRTSTNIAIEDLTATSSGTLVADLAAVRAYDDDWFYLFSDLASKGEIQKLRAAIETARKIYWYETADSEVYDTGTTDDVFSAGTAGTYANSVGVYHPDVYGGADAGWGGVVITSTPGEINPAGKTIRGVRALSMRELSQAKQTAIKAKRGNHYTSIAGAGHTWDGITGSAEFVDTIALVHYLYARIPEAVIAALRVNKRIPYTAQGLEVINGAIKGALLERVGKGLQGDPAPFVTSPAIDPVLKQQRSASGFKFGAVLEGAINSVGISGSLTVDPTLFA